MSETTPKTFVLQGAPRAEFARLCRQICLDREEGKMSPITAEDELVLALTTVRATYGPASVSENDFKNIVATEESRVAEAAVLAQLISSRLSANLPPAVVTDAQHVTPNGHTAPSLPTTIPFPSAASTAPLSVADLIDGMLAEEKRGAKSRSKN